MLTHVFISFSGLKSPMLPLHCFRNSTYFITYIIITLYVEWSNCNIQFMRFRWITYKICITVTCKSPVTSAQFEINFHRACQLCKEWPRNTSVSKMEPKESWWSDASATRNFSLVVKFSKTEIWIRHDSLPYIDEPNPNWFT